MSAPADLGPPRAGDLEISVESRIGPNGGVDGRLVVRNVSARAVRLHGRPTYSPVGLDGRLLDAPTVTTLELRLPDHVDLEPGRSAYARYSWRAWDGPRAGPSAAISWNTEDSLTVAVHGPVQPTATAGPTNITTSWFSLLDD